MALRTMTSVASIAFSLVVVCTPVAAGQSPALDWTFRMKDHEASATTVDEMGNVVVTGCAKPERYTPNAWFDKCSEIFVTKISTHGEEVWTYRKESLGVGHLFAVAVNRLGDVFITGAAGGDLTGARENTSGWFDLFVMSILANGTHSWTYQITSGTAWPKAATLDKAGNVIVAGYTVDGNSLPGSTGSGSGFVMKLHADGVWAWTTHTEEPQASSLTRTKAITTDLDDNIFVAWIGGVMNKFLPDGTLDSTTNINSTQMDRIEGITFDKVGDVFIVGVASAGLPWGEVVVKIYANGTQAWWTSFNTGWSSEREAIAVDSESNVYTVNDGRKLQRVHADGSLGWTFDQITSARPTGIAVDEQGNVLVTVLHYDFDDVHDSEVLKIKQEVSVEEVSSASRGVGTEQMLAAVAAVLLAMVLNPLQSAEMEQL